TGSPFGAKVTPSYAPASISSTEVQRIAPVAASSAKSGALEEAPLPAREANTRPLRTPATQVVQSPGLKGRLTVQSSAPVSRSCPMIGASLGTPLGTKEVWRTRNSLPPSVTGCQAMIDGFPPDQS